ncbi:Flp pilus assembly protein TadG [Mesorhizobium soli]|uniref:pilus assembly protein n=1 Tax=Pseudaminobacter soli (ex Li et al. 2025) TaxID=1295366 RepID=UPI0024731C85|nr:pilus assembly protein [Mesorhizobium soli]MDH6229963.1 Flp pilus assembly protein TadG [Mesorhizobium soli]
MLLNRFWRSKSGNFAMMFAIALPAILAAVGLALDVTNLMTARSNLQNALDSAVLAASRLADASSSRTDAFDGFFRANIANRSDLVNATARLNVQEGVNSVKTAATAEADVALNFGFLFGKSAHLVVNASAYESTARLEVALVLDNTGSMGASNMQALRDSAKSLIDTLATVKAQRPERVIRAALVPFVTAVNIKAAGFYSDSWVDLRTSIPDTDKGLNGKNFDPDANKNRTGHIKLFNNLGVAWKGCVEARPIKFNADGSVDMANSPGLNDTPPDPQRPETLFVPYFAPDEPGDPATARNADDASKNYQFNNSYLADLVAGMPKTDQELASSKTTDAAFQSTQRNLAKYTAANAKTGKINEVAPLTSGPNYACATPIMPLTDDLNKLKAEIDKMTYWNGSGTNVAEGISWGYRVLSPTEPFSQGDPFDSDGTTKVAVVFTDGENNVFGQGGTFNKSDYGAYNYLADGRMGSNVRATALKNVNTMTQTMCSALKAKGVRVFTVLLGASADTTANRDLYSKCATTPSNYYLTKTQDQLKAAFKDIAFSISQLYVTN